MKPAHAAVAFTLALGLFPPVAEAAATIVQAGQTRALQEDLVLNGDDVLEIKGTAEKPCTLVGNQHQIRTGPRWTGSIKIIHCTIQKLGEPAKRADNGQVTGPGAPAIDVKAVAKADVTIEHCTFDTCSAIHIQNDDNSVTAFRNNTVLENTVVAISKDIANSAHTFVARGNSKEKKRFQGNFIPRGKIVFNAPNWLVGGDRDEDGNILIGLRIGIDAQGDGTLVRKNYFHLFLTGSKEFPYWSQVSVFTTGRGVIGEDNVIRDGEWIVRFVEGEFRNNIIMDINDHDLMQNGSNGRIHHNLFIAGPPKPHPGEMGGCIMVIYPPKNPGEGIEIFNNVFDGGGRLAVPAIEVAPKAFVKSLRNNVFFNFAHGEGERKYKGGHAMIRTGWGEDASKDKPARLGYADYNLFYSPTAKANRNYQLSVADKVERKDAGFGLNDVPRGGNVDAQVDPKFKGPIPKAFPFTDDEIKARKVTISKVLALYRDAYSPAEGSPLIGAGDPADGPGTNIGAIGPAKP
jgi:hypothetical protein